MSNYIFLTKNNADGTEPRIYSPISEDKIETLNLCDTYDHNGQEVGHYNAGDYHLDNSESPAISDCITAISEKFGIDEDDIHIVDEGDDDFKIEAGDGEEYGFNEEEVNKFIKNWREENETLTEVEGFTFWDGHNWKTITTSCDDGEPSHNIVYDEKLIKELNDAIENKEFEKERTGVKIYKHNGWVILDSCWAGEWAEYDILAEAEYEMNQTQY